jgi:phosphoribosylamine--glycine ligase
MHRNLKVLIIGSGGREHALHWAISKSPLVSEVLCAPGNGGIPIEDRREIKESDTEGIIALAKENGVDLVVIGPEAPLAEGIIDRLTSEGISAFGPSRLAAELESSKIFMKTRCLRWGIPTANFNFAGSFKIAEGLIKKHGFRVIKADGLCGGKGVYVTDSEEAALGAAYNILEKKIHGKAGERIVMEERLEGAECSIEAFCDGDDAVFLPPARDFKRMGEGDTGPNTGGMGAYSPLPDVDDALLAKIRERIFLPVFRGMAGSGRPVTGLLYAGLMLTEDGPKVLEFNVRFGDPETQVILSLIESDIVEYMLGTLERNGLASLCPLNVRQGAAVGTVLCSKGYPGKYETGYLITGNEKAEKSALVFHAGTKWTPEGLITSGGRVEATVGIGRDIKTARQRSLKAADAIQFENRYLRRDIATGL